MFTGIIQYVGSLLSVRPTADGRRLGIDLGPLAAGLAPGQSLAVNGACLTVSALDGPRGQFDVVAETLSRTTLGSLAAGAKVNLEPALPLGGRLDGHLVQGHVDGLATVSRIDRAGQWRVRFDAPADLTAQMVPKGSVALDGVSLTLAEADEEGFAVALIPTTLADTTLARLEVASKVNVEADLIGKYVRRYLQGQAPTAPGADAPLTMDRLRDAGFA